MKQFFSLLSFLILSLTSFAQTFDEDKMRYIEQYKYWAMDEQVRTGVPASISLAQGILETGAGQSELCTEANNHFGIKCKTEWTGDTYLHDDDRKAECFRKYPSAKESYIDHSNFLRTRSHYNFLFDLEITDYKAWCAGLKKAGYATNPRYPERLSELIEQYDLQKYTYEAIEIARENKLVAEVVPINDRIENDQEVALKQDQTEEVVTNTHRDTKGVVFDKLIVKNGRKGFWAKKGDYLLPEAIQYNIRYAKLLELNELDDAPLERDMFIYLKRKSKTGDRFYHQVASGENMHSISQNTGVQLKYLYLYNNMFEGEEPMPGEKIYLQGKSNKTPRLANHTNIDNNYATDVTPTIKKVKELVVNDDELKKQQRELEIIEENKKRLEAELLKSEQEAQKLREEQAALAIEQAKQKETEVNEIDKQTTNNVKVDAQQVANKIELKASDLSTDKLENPIIDPQKAKRIEELMNDGTLEVDKLTLEKELQLKQADENQDDNKIGQKPEMGIEKVVIPAPATNNEEIEIDKANKNKAKQKSLEQEMPNTKEIEKNYDDKNVSDDIKDLKKKFDRLIKDN